MTSAPFILGIDASRSRSHAPTGVEYYSNQIIQALLELEQPWRVRLYTPAPLPQFPEKSQRVIPFPRFWSLFRLSLELLLHKPDVLFVPAHVLPFFAPKNSVVTIHDIAYERFPKAYGRMARLYLRWSTRRAVKKARALLVPTEQVKKDLGDYYGADLEKIHVVHHGPLPLPQSHAKAVRDEKLLFVGRLEHKKNIVGLLEAWELVQEERPQARLVLAGKPGYGFDAIQEKLRTAKGVESLGYVPEQDLAELLGSVRGLVLPSLDEGFGFPLLQAFASDCPVLCSDIPPLREVGQDAALYAKDRTALAAGMNLLLDDENLRKNLTAKGRERLKDFSWEKAAKASASILLENPLHSAQ